MKKNHLFLKTMALAVLLLMVVSAKAATTITVGPSPASFTTIALAYASITDATGGYVIELQSNYSPAGETYPITLGAKTNANSAGNGITIQPKAGNATTFTFTAATTQIFNLSGATYVTIDGLDATKFVIDNSTVPTTPTPTVSQCVLITNDASNNTIKNITTQSICTAATGAIAIVAGATNVTGEDGNTISNCIVKDGATKYTGGIYVNDAKATNTTIQNNNIQNIVTFAGVDAFGIYIASADNTTGTTTVSSNNIYWTVTMALASGKTQYGINCAVGRTKIELNNIGYATSTQTGTANFLGNSGSVFAGIGISTSLAFTCQNNKIANLIVKQNFNTATASSGIYLTSAGAGTFNSNIIEGITITPNGTNTNEFRGISNTSTNGTAKNFNGNIIRNCTNGATASAATVNIISGIFQGTAAAASTYSNNQIYGLSAGNASSTAANSVNGIKISVNTGNGILIERNLIYNLTTVSTTGTTTGVVTGIQTVGGNTGTTIQNNMIDLGNSFTLDNTIYGIYQSAATAATNPFKYYHNSVYIGGTAQASATLPTYAFYRTGATVPTTNDVRNNILANQRTNTSGAAKHYAIAVAAATDLSACNYNLYWANTVGLIGATDKTTLASDWKAALTPSNDANSYSSNPKFLLPAGATPNLHINTAVLSDAENNGTFLTGVVTTDYDNDTRAGANSKADIGADEYTVSIVVSAPTVSTTAVSNITRTTATSGVTIDSNGNATITASGVVWSTSAIPDANVVGATKTTDGTGAITGLNSGTTYHVRAYATNSAGTSYGSELTFSTTVTIDANPADANGTVTGGGPFSTGATVTLTATATASGKRFVNWTENGVPVSVNRIYAFTASSDRTLVANFGTIYTTYYVRPSGSTKWANIGAAADQIITTDNFNLAYLADNTPDKAATYYFAAGTYTITGVAATGTQLTNGKIYGGFTGDESSINLDARATSDLDGNGIIEAWELTNATVLSGRTGFKYAEAGTTDGERLIRIDADGEVNGVTLTDFKYGSYSGAISIGLPGSADDASGKQGTMKRCIVRKIKSAIGAIQLINSRSVVDQCLIEDCYGSTSYGAVYFNKYGGTLSNSIVRNNFATTEGGAIYAGNAAATTDLKAIVINCLIYNNEATTKGGAISSKSISSSYGGIEIVNSTIANNKTGATGNASVEFDGSGLIVNSIVVGDNIADLYATSTSNYVNGVVYGTVGAGSAALTITNVVSAKVTSDMNFTSPTSSVGYQGIVVNAAYTNIQTAKFTINSTASTAVTTTSLGAVPSTYSSITAYSTVPTTDITSLTRTGNLTLGAYQATHSVASGVTETITQPTTLASLTVAAGGKLTINNGIATTIGTLTLQSDASGNATMLNSGTFTGTVIAEQFLGSARNWYVSSPVTSALSPSNNVDYYYEYVEAGSNNPSGQPGSSTTYWKGLANGTTMEIGKGYIAKSNAGTTVQFSGTPNNGNITTTFDLTRNDAMGKGFNLVGNPYPSYIDWSLVSTANPNLSTTFYFRSKNTNVTSTYTFVTYNGLLNTSVSSNGTANTNITRFIPPTQAFWVRINSGTSATKMYFNNNMRAHRDDNGNLLKAPKVDNRTRLRLQLINGSEADETLICTEANAENGFDIYDSPKMMNNSSITPDLYTRADAERLVINGLNSIIENLELQLGFSLNAAASLKLKATEISNLPIGTRVYLLDKVESTQTELLPETEYNFNTITATINNESRFSLLFRAPGVTTDVYNTSKLNAQVFVNTANQIVVIAPEKSNYAIYNAVGQLIENGITNSKLITHNSKLTTGVYVVKVNNQSIRVIVK